MKRFILPFCSVLALSLSFTACKKDKETVAPAKTRTELLTESGRKWKITDTILQQDSAGVNQGAISFFPLVPNCTKDDFLTFRADHTITRDEGATKCSPTDPQTDAGTWALGTNDTQLTFIGIDGNVDLTGKVFTVTELTATTMRLTTTETMGVFTNKNTLVLTAY